LTIIALDLLRDIQKVNNWNPGCSARHIGKRRLDNDYFEERSFGLAHRYCCILRFLDNGYGSGGAPFTGQYSRNGLGHEGH